MKSGDTCTGAGYTLTDGTATFNGAAFMGAETAPGATTHEFDGTWSGSFFGATEDDGDTTDVNESITAPLATAAICAFQ